MRQQRSYLCFWPRNLAPFVSECSAYAGLNLAMLGEYGAYSAAVILIAYISILQYKL